jgi:hypothetical protein
MAGLSAPSLLGAPGPRETKRRISTGTQQKPEQWPASDQTTVKKAAASRILPKAPALHLISRINLSRQVPTPTPLALCQADSVQEGVVLAQTFRCRPGL